MSPARAARRMPWLPGRRRAGRPECRYPVARALPAPSLFQGHVRARVLPAATLSSGNFPRRLAYLGLARMLRWSLQMRAYWLLLVPTLGCLGLAGGDGEPPGLVDGGGTLLDGGAPADSGAPDAGPPPGDAGPPPVDAGAAIDAGSDGGVAACVRPTAASTGVPPGTVLTPRTGDIVVTTPGQVLEKLDLRGTIWVRASNVTIRQSRIWGGPIDPNDSPIHVDSTTTGTVIEDCEIGPDTGADPRRAITGDAHFTVRRVNIHNHQTAVRAAWDVRIENSYFHHPGGPDSSGVFSYLPRGPGAIALYCNDIAMGVPAPGTPQQVGNDAYEGVDQTSTSVPLADLVLDHNWFGGGSYAVYIKHLWKSATVTHNRWDRRAAYGPIDFTATTNGTARTPLVWTDNAYEDGQVIKEP